MLFSYYCNLILWEFHSVSKFGTQFGVTAISADGFITIII